MLRWVQGPAAQGHYLVMRWCLNGSRGGGPGGTDWPQDKPSEWLMHQDGRGSLRVWSLGGFGKKEAEFSLGVWSWGASKPIPERDMQEAGE